jgi:hypothetical protein
MNFSQNYQMDDLLENEDLLNKEMEVYINESKPYKIEGKKDLKKFEGSLYSQDLDILFIKVKQ